MDSTFRDIIRHTAVFGVGAILARLASVVLIPLYTRYLSPEDYGTIALIDLMVNLLGITAGGGIASAAIREHYREATTEHVGRVWWTAIAVVGVLAAAVFAAAFVSRDPLARLTFGEEVVAGTYYFTLALSTLWIGLVASVVESYFRTEKASVLLVSLGLGRLLLNIALNVLFLTWLNMGVAAILWGNLLTTVAICAVMMALFVRKHAAVRLDTRLIGPYWRFGWPLVLFGLLSALMHEADRYMLRTFLDLGEVGVYSLAYQIGQGVNTLVIVPFFTIWSVMLYEVAQRPDHEQVYARVFKNYAMVLALVLLFASMFADPIIRVVAAPEYAAAGAIIPVICLAYFFFSLHDQFKVPALLANRTASMLPTVSLAVIANVAANLLLIPALGAMGAAWASVATFVVFSGAGLVRYRRIARYPYPLWTCAAVVTGMIATYGFHQFLKPRMANDVVWVLAGILLWASWAAALFGATGLELTRGALLQFRRVSPAGVQAVDTSTAPRERARALAGVDKP